MISLIAKIPAAARSLLMLSRLIAIYKDAEQQSVRPIAIGEVFYRLTSRMVTQEDTSSEDFT
jgi:hypothetical protein